MQAACRFLSVALVLTAATATSAGAAQADATAVPGTRAAHLAALRAADGTSPDDVLRYGAPAAAATAMPHVEPQPNPMQLTGAASPLRVIDEGFDRAELNSSDGRHRAAGGIFAEGWIRQNNSDAPSNTWMQGLPMRFLALDGTNQGYIGSHPLSTLSDAGTISSWLLTPPINFTPDTRLSFHTRTETVQQFPTRLQVRACNTGICADVGTLPDDVGDFVALIHDINPTEVLGVYPSTWTRIELTAADGLPTSGTGRIAFRHLVHQDDDVLRGDWLGIDRVVVEQGSDTGAGALDLALTVALADPADPTACGSATTLDLVAGDQVNLCYRATNTGSEPLRYHGLRDTHVGPIFSQRDTPIAPGATLQHNRLLTVTQSMALSSTWIAQRDPDGYVIDDSAPAAYLDATDGLLIDDLMLAGNNGLPLPPAFDFRLFGNRLDRLCASSFGVVGDVRDFRGCVYSQMAFGLRPLPDSELTIHGSVLALFEASFQAGGAIYQKTFGSAPNRRYVIEYFQRPVAGGSSDPARGLGAQVVLNETSGVIEFQYDNVLFGGQPSCAYGGCASIGVQTQNYGQQYSFGTPSLRNVSRIAWTPSDRRVATRTRQVQLDVTAARLSLDAEAIAVQAASGGTATATLAIGNDGNGRLDWRAGVAAPNGHLPTVSRAVLPSATSPLAFGARPAAPRSLSPDIVPSRYTPVPHGAGSDQVLWAFDIGNALLISADPAAPGYDRSVTVEGTPGPRLFTGADFLDDDFSRLLAFDAETHTLRSVGPTTVGGALAQDSVLGRLPITLGHTASGLKQDPTTGTIYLATSDGFGSRLWTVDVASVAMTLVGDIDNASGIITMDFDNDGDLYGIDVMTDSLVAIDKHSGAGSVVGALGIQTYGAIVALAFDPAFDAQFYLATQDGVIASFWAVDKASGQARLISTMVGPDGSLVQLGAMAVARPGNRCVALSQVPWLSLGSDAGSVAPGASADVVLTFDAGGLADGVYRTNLCLHSNDITRRRAALPLRFTVGDALFSDSFDTAATP